MYGKKGRFKLVKFLLTSILLIFFTFMLIISSIYRSIVNDIEIQNIVNEIQSGSNYVQAEDISQIFLDAIVAIEDHRFYKHGAIDLISIARATFINIKNKESLAKYRSNYINKEYEAITKKGKLVTVERDDGTRITTSWSKLTPDQKQTVIKRLYSEASTVSKIKYWTIDLGNIYRTNSKTEYNKYRSLFGSHIQYKENWNKSKFIK